MGLMDVPNSVKEFELAAEAMALEAEHIRRFCSIPIVALMIFTKPVASLVLCGFKLHQLA
jgi:hypothetical protein